MQFAFLQVQPGARQLADIAGVVVVQVGDDHVLDVGGGDAQRLQRVDGAAQELAAARAGGRLVEAGVNQPDARAVPDDPDEIVHRHWAVVRVRRGNEVLAAAAGHGGVAQGIDFVVRQRHAIPSTVRMWSSSGLR
ncbi:hypothetical protein D3C71_1668520 [compost metagenome]